MYPFANSSYLSPLPLYLLCSLSPCRLLFFRLCVWNTLLWMVHYFNCLFVCLFAMVAMLLLGFSSLRCLPFSSKQKGSQEMSLEAHRHLQLLYRTMLNPVVLRTRDKPCDIHTKSPITIGKQRESIILKHWTIFSPTIKNNYFMKEREGHWHRHRIAWHRMVYQKTHIALLIYLFSSFIHALHASLIFFCFFCLLVSFSCSSSCHSPSVLIPSYFPFMLLLPLTQF